MNTTEILRLVRTATATGQHCRAQSEHAFAQLVAHYQGPLFGFLGRMGFAQAQAEDLAQESFLRAWRHLHNYDAQRAEFSTWLFSIARNLALNEWKRAAHQNEVWEGHAPADAASTAPTPPELLERKQQQAQLQAALALLAVADRCVLALAYISELDMASIARIEACSLAAVKTRLYRARQRLLEILEKPHA